MSNYSNISEVSRISGVPKDLLRMWERRYGYPDPVRDNNGDRRYSQEQLDKLVVIRQLLDQGLRPGKLMSMPILELQALIKKPDLNDDQQVLIDLLNSDNVTGLHEWFDGHLYAHGLRGFVHKVMGPASEAVGIAWSEGRLAIYEEHLFTEVVATKVRQALAQISPGKEEPRVMLTTMSGEQHSLGLLMVQTLLTLGGANVVSFGTEMPFGEIRKAAYNYQVDIIGLSFSRQFRMEEALVLLNGLRQMIDDDIQIWAGGESFEGEFDMPRGVKQIEDLGHLERCLVDWKRDN